MLPVANNWMIKKIQADDLTLEGNYFESGKIDDSKMSNLGGHLKTASATTNIFHDNITLMRGCGKTEDPAE